MFNYITVLKAVNFCSALAANYSNLFQVICFLHVSSPGTKLPASVVHRKNFQVGISWGWKQLESVPNVRSALFIYMFRELCGILVVFI